MNAISPHKFERRQPAVIAQEILDFVIIQYHNNPDEAEARTTFRDELDDETMAAPIVDHEIPTASQHEPGGHKYPKDDFKEGETAYDKIEKFGFRLRMRESLEAVANRDHRPCDLEELKQSLGILELFAQDHDDQALKIISDLDGESQTTIDKFNTALKQKRESPVDSTLYSSTGDTPEDKAREYYFHQTAADKIRGPLMELFRELAASLNITPRNDTPGQHRG